MVLICISMISDAEHFFHVPVGHFCFIDYAKAFDCVDHNKLWKILKEMGIPDHLTCLLRNLYAGHEATVRTGHGTTDWFQIGKGVRQGCILPPCLFNLYAEDIMRNAGLEEAQAGIKISGRNISNLRYADDITLIAESEEELKSLLMKVKEESEKVGLKLNIQKRKIIASGPITSWEIDGETVARVADFILGGSKITADGDCSHEIKRRLLLGRKVMTNLDSILKSRDITLPTKFCLVKDYFQRNPRADLLQNGLVGSPCSPRDSQESSPIPQFKSISSLALSFLYSPTLTSIHDYWKNHSFV